MVGMAAGLARSGFRPIVYGLSAFIPVRILEQIKLDVAPPGHNDKTIIPILIYGFSGIQNTTKATKTGKKNICRLNPNNKALG